MDAIDFIVDNDGELLIENGDFAIGLSDEQHIADILVAYPGEFKEFPMLGVNIGKAINGSLDGEIKKEIRLQLVADGFNVSAIEFVEDKLSIDAVRS